MFFSNLTGYYFQWLFAYYIKKQTRQHIICLLFNNIVCLEYVYILAFSTFQFSILHADPTFIIVLVQLHCVAYTLIKVNMGVVVCWLFVQFCWIKKISICRFRIVKVSSDGHSYFSHKYTLTQIDWVCSCKSIY